MYVCLFIHAACWSFSCPVWGVSLSSFDLLHVDPACCIFDRSLFSRGLSVASFGLVGLDAVLGPVIAGHGAMADVPGSPVLCSPF